MAPPLRSRIRALRAILSGMRYRKWPTKDIFEEIYAKGKWATGGKGGFNSGSGSDATPSKPYIDLVRHYIQLNSVRSVVDLGCGDFRVGKQICEGSDISYVGIDIVDPLVSFLNSSFATENVRFMCLDITEDPIPHADIYLLRQVLQHLSNAQICKILEKISGRTALVTEHIPTAPAIYNKDKTAGPDIRLYRNSGVFIEHHPFSIKAETLLEVPHPFNGVDAVLRTSLIRSA